MTDRRVMLVRGGLLVLAAAGVIVGGVVVATVPPTAGSFYPKCQFHTLTGLHCPGCGTTRAAHAVLNGDVPQALAYNPLAFVIVPLMTFVFARTAWQWAWHSGDPDAPLVPGCWWLGKLLVGAMFAFWVLRNVPVYPLTLLAPHELTR